MQIRALGILALGARSAEARYRPKHLNTRSLDATPGSKSPSVSNASRPGSFEPKAIAYFPYTATNPGEPLRPEGFITFQYLAENAARIEVRLSNLPEGKGPFSYHIHTARVPDVITDPTPQCKDALAHLDPYGVGEPFKCDPSQRQSCQVGDLSGKYGVIPDIIKPTQVFREVYEDSFVSWRPDQPNFFANRSVVIHNSINKTRIACANILTL